MKKISTLFVFCFLYCAFGNTFALSGSLQDRVERLYDIYRIRFIEGKSEEVQSANIKGTQTAIKKTLTTNTSIGNQKKETLLYFQHLLCQAESVIDGTACEDTYNTPGPLTTNKDAFTLAQLRDILIQEHSARRVNRGLSALTESTKLDAIAQKYALDLCNAGFITHELYGSTLEERYNDGGYDYTWGGENLGSGQDTVAEILDQLTTSLHHRENMYHPEFQEVGVGQCDDIWVINYGTEKKSKK